MTSDLEILDVPAVAKLLGKSESAASALFRQGKLPGRKCGKTWQTTPEAVKDYLAGKPPIDEEAVERRAMQLAGAILQRVGTAMIDEAKSA